jgi:hypothetical protein
MTLLLTMLLACGDKEQADTSVEEQTEETQPSSEPATEEPQDSASEELEDSGEA